MTKIISNIIIFHYLPFLLFILSIKSLDKINTFIISVWNLAGYITTKIPTWYLVKNWKKKQKSSMQKEKKIINFEHDIAQTILSVENISIPITELFF